MSALASGNASGRHERGCTGNGCPPKFWKNNLQAWKGTGCSPGQQKKNKKGNHVAEWTSQGGTTFYDVFGFEPETSGQLHRSNGAMTLLDVLIEQEYVGSGSVEAHMVAAFLNAAKAPAVFGATRNQIAELARAVRMGVPYQGRVIEHSEFFGLLQTMNQAGDCFLNNNGQCAPGYVEQDGRCIPSCPRGYRYDLNSRQCVSLDDWNDSCKGIDD